MLEILQQIDSTVFLFINMTLANPVTNLIMPYITSDIILRIVYAAAMISVLIFGNARLRWMVLFSAVVLLLTDQIAANFLKDLIGRMRPCQTFDIDQINLLVGCGGGKSMPSAHSANAFGQAVFWSFYQKKLSIYFYIYASLIALSRVFVGVHYPGDILFGAVIGVIIGSIFVYLFSIFKKRFIK